MVLGALPTLMPGLNDLEREGLEEIAYLSRSRNRVLVLAALTADTTPPGHETPGHEPRALRETTGVSEATLNRVLNGFQERGWVRRGEEGRYRATPEGEHVAEAFEPVVGSMAALGQLGEAAAVVPTGDPGPRADDGFSIALRHFQGATVRTPDSWDPTDPWRYYAELLDGASTFRSLVYIGPSREIMAAMREEADSGDLSSTGVFGQPLVERFRQSPDVGPNQSDLEPDGMRIFSYDGHLPCNLWVVDETVVLENSQVATVEPGTIVETDDEAVRAWALELIDAYIDASEEVRPDELPSGK